MSLRSPSEAESTCGNSRKSRRFSPPGEMRPISAEANRGKSHLISGTSKGSFTLLLQVKKFHDIPVSTREESRESLPHPEERRFRLLAREEGSFPPWSEKNPGVPVASQEEALSRGKARGTPGSCHHSQSPQMSQSIPGKPVFPALPRLSSRGSTHTTVARGTALSESLVGKPRGKATDPLIHAKGSVTLLIQLGRKAHVHAHTRDED